jgi:hypothetical protein
MRCSNPITLSDPSRRRVSYLAEGVVPCGKCGGCRSRKRAEWSWRIGYEMKSASSAFFLTLTYNDEHLPWGDLLPCLDRDDFTRFMKRLRKKQEKYSKVKLRYYGVGEYGTKTWRPHYHVLVMNLAPAILYYLDEIWPKGHVHVGDANERTIHYITKYHVNVDKTKTEFNGEDILPKEFTSMSGGLGRKYLEDNKAWQKSGTGKLYIMNNGFKQPLPKYMREKLFTQEEKDLLVEIGMQEGRKVYSKEFDRLYKLGYSNPDAKMARRNKEAGEKYLDKANEHDTF